MSETGGLSNKKAPAKRRKEFIRVCAYPPCGMEFKTYRCAQKYHSGSCRKADYFQTHIRNPVTLDEWEEFQRWKKGSVEVHA